MLILIELLLLLAMFGGLAFFTNNDDQVLIWGKVISPVVLSIVFMVFGMLATFPIFFRQRAKYKQKIKKLKSTGKEVVKENKAIKKEIVKENKATKKEKKRLLNDEK